MSMSIALSQPRHASKAGDAAAVPLSARGRSGSIMMTRGPSGFVLRRTNGISFSEEDLKKAILDTRTATIVKVRPF